jgi:hypothetical protein
MWAQLVYELLALKFVYPTRSDLLQTVFLQLRLVQSLPVRQRFEFAHLEQAGPPQSTSVSSWFFTSSEHVGIALGKVGTLAQ